MKTELTDEPDSKQRRYAVRKLTAIAAFSVTALGALWCTGSFAAGATDADGYLYKLTGALISALLLAALFIFERITKLRLPDFLYVFLALFIVCALVLGRSFDFYARFEHWDKLLHTVSGVLFFFSGMCIGTLILGDRMEANGRYVAAVTIFAFIFALAVGYVWELFEFAGDSLLGMDNQRWAEGIVSENADGTFTVTDKRGTALIDTLGDMIVNFIGAAVSFAANLIFWLRRPQRMKNAVGFSRNADSSPVHEKNR